MSMLAWAGGTDSVMQPDFQILISVIASSQREVKAGKLADHRKKYLGFLIMIGTSHNHAVIEGQLALSMHWSHFVHAIHDVMQPFSDPSSAANQTMYDWQHSANKSDTHRNK